MRPLAALLLLALAGCGTTAAPYVHRASPRQAAAAFLHRKTTVETCDGQMLAGYVQAVRTDSLDLGRGRRVAWANVHTMTAPVGTRTGPSMTAFLGGTALTVLLTAVTSANAKPCEDCEMDYSGLVGPATAVLGGAATFLVSGIVLLVTPKIQRTYGFFCQSASPSGG